jgi:hypothetical protein
MNGPVAQWVALTCHANAYLRGRRIPEFFPSNLICKLCDRVKFFHVSKMLLGRVWQAEVATTSNGWFEHLKAEHVPEVPLSCTPVAGGQLVATELAVVRINAVRIGSNMLNLLKTA